MLNRRGLFGAVAGMVVPKVAPAFGFELTQEILDDNEAAELLYPEWHPLRVRVHRTGIDVPWTESGQLLEMEAEKRAEKRKVDG